jgi:hypothetical protein
VSGDRRVIRGLAGLLVAVVLLLCAAAPAASDPAATVGQCLANGEVWLHVQTDEGEVLRSECVGRPTSGMEALETAQVRTTQSSGAYLCTLAGYPDQCPASYNGRYWQYWHADAADQDWSYSQKGPGEYRPPGGSIEGWCYNAASEDRCRLPTLSAADPKLPRIDHTALSQGGSAMWTVVLAVAAAVGAGVVWLRRSRRTNRPLDA